MVKIPVLLVLALAYPLAAPVGGQAVRGPDTVVVASGPLKLRALLWRPAGPGPFPAVLFSHGGRSLEGWPSAVGSVFARHGYTFLYLFRRGIGLSADQGTSRAETVSRELAAKGTEARNRLYVRLLETDELSDALAGLAFLRALSDVDPRRMAVAGHSSGAIVSLLLAERDSTLRAAVDFAGAARAWEGSPQLRERLLSAVRGAMVPIFIVHAANDVSLAPAKALGAELARLGKPHRVKIYPPIGRTADDGHRFVFLSVPTWEPDVFAFLDERMQDRGVSTSTLKKVSVNGTTISYVDEGTGPAVVFVHGAYSDHRIWERQREVVAKGYRFVALDLRYFGTAPWSDDGTHFNVATHAADVAAFIRELRVGPVHLVGRSYGAITALAVAVRHPDVVRSLFLNEPGIATAITDPEQQKRAAEDRGCVAPVVAAAKTGNHAEAVKLFFECTHGQPGGFDSLPPAHRAMLLDNARTVALQVDPARRAPRITCAQLGEIELPIAITRGELTRPFYQITVGAVHRCIPRSQLITVKGATHGAPSQQPAAFNEALLAFLARTSAKSLHVNGYDIAYIERGTGQPILLLHGGLSDYRHFSYVMEPLSAKYRVIAMSRRHHYPERWDGKGGDASTRQHVADVVAFIRKLDAGPVHLVGHSRGGGLALYVASAHPELLRTLTMAEGGGMLVPGNQERSRQRVENMLAMYEQGRREEALANFFDEIYGPGSWSGASEARRQGWRDNAWTIAGAVDDEPDP